MKGKGNNRRKGKGSNNRRPLPEKGTKNQRRDAEIADTASKEYADSRSRRDCYKSTSNDWQWYAQSPQLIRDYASYPFGRALGTKIDLGSIPTKSSINSTAVPGIMTYYFAPAVGSPHDANAPINIAARNIYSFVRHANSGHANYDAPDLMLYLLAMDSVYMYHSFLKRILGLVYDYSTLNRYYPEAIITSMGVSFDDIMHHIPDLRGFINVYASKMGSMCVPNSMSYMARHVWMCEGIYTDGSAAKSQTYLYSPSHYYLFGYDNSGAGQLTLKVFCNASTAAPYANVKTFADLVDFGNALLDPIVSNEDMNIMSGDILKAFGDSGVIKVMGVPEGYMILPVYNQEVLSQMENCTILGQPVAGSITQNTEVGGGYLTIANNAIAIPVQGYSTTAGAGTMLAASANNLLGAIMEKKLLNFHHSGVTPEEVMVATRLSNLVAQATQPATTIIYSNGQLGITVEVPTMSSELVTGAWMYSYVWDSNGVLRLDGTQVPPVYVYPRGTNIPGTSSSIFSNFANFVGKLSTFDWHPQISSICVDYVSASAFNNPTPIAFPIQDVDNYTIIDEANLLNMATTALLSEFSVPQMGAFSSKLT